MIQPELFDIIELLVNLPNKNLYIGSQGTIIECYDNKKYEVEFSNEEGETIALCTLTTDQFIVVWQSKTQR